MIVGCLGHNGVNVFFDDPFTTINSLTIPYRSSRGTVTQWFVTVLDGTILFNVGQVFRHNLGQTFPVAFEAEPIFVSSMTWVTIF